MNRRQVLPLLAGMPVMLSGCGPVVFRYKLTLALDTPDGIKSASTVTEVRYQPSIPTGIPGPIPTKVDGEALYLDLGPGNRPLIALRGWNISVANSGKPNPPRQDSPAWGQYYLSPCFLAKLYGEKQCGSDVEAAASFGRYRGARPLKTTELPNLITFADSGDPASVILVNPDNPSAALGQSVRWQAMTLEFTDEPATRGIDNKLPWLKGMRWGRGLDGRAVMTNSIVGAVSPSFFWPEGR
jgi:hypothetical protein